jgi:PAS domain S-box-containing protein
MSEQSSNHEPFRVILDSIADGVFTVDKDWRITSFNRAAERITGVPRDEAIGQPCSEVLHASICESHCTLRQTLETGKPVIDKSIYIVATDGRRVPVSISTALLYDEQGEVIGGAETFRDLSVVEELRRELGERRRFEDMISRNDEMQRIFEILPDLAASDATILIEGPSGSGQELLARAVHNQSPRREKPLVVVNSAALPETLLESELFGYKAGAFTDARSDKPGRIAVAEGGSLFLDEIGDLSPASQAKLLRVLQERTYEPLGATEPVKADVRVIAATNRDIDELVERNRFREDLYYRLNVLRLTLPPLAERLEDIPLLVDHFLAHLETIRPKGISGVSDEALAVMMRYAWPGNIRELENAVEHAHVLCRDRTIRPEHLPAALQPDQDGLESAEPRTLREVVKDAIRRALVRNNGRRVATARELGIDKGTLRRKIKRLGIDAPPSPYRPGS